MLESTDCTVRAADVMVRAAARQLLSIYWAGILHKRLERRLH